MRSSVDWQVPGEGVGVVVLVGLVEMVVLAEVAAVVDGLLEAVPVVVAEEVEAVLGLEVKLVALEAEVDATFEEVESL